MTSAAAFVGPLVAGGLARLSFPPWEFAWLAFLAPALLFWSATFRRPVESLVGAYVGGAAFHWAALDWIRTSGGWEGLDGPRAFGWALTGAVAGASWCVPALVAMAVAPRRPVLFTLLGAAAWVAGEHLRFHVFRAIDDLGFPWLQLGHTQIDNPIAQIADLGGVWLVSFEVAACGAFLAAALHEGPHTVLPAAALVLLMVVGTLTYASVQMRSVEAEPALTVVLHPEHLPTFAEEAFCTEPPAVRTNGRIPVLHLWPECAAGTVHNPAENQGPHASESRKRLERWANWSRRTGQSAVVGAVWTEVEGAYNAALVFTPTRGLAGSYRKRFLVPYVEFQPKNNLGGGFLGFVAFRAGDTAPVFEVPRVARPPLRFGVTICYDTCFPELFDGTLWGGAPDVFVAIGDESADDTGALARFMLTLARFRAIETRTPLVRCVAGGHSAIIDRCGQLVQSSPAVAVSEGPLVWTLSIPCGKNR